jgi:hypothetical protein
VKGLATLPTSSVVALANCPSRLFVDGPLLPLNIHIVWLMILLYDLEPMRGSLLSPRKRNLLEEAVAQSKLPDFYACLGTPVPFIRFVGLLYHGYFT